MSRVRGLMIVLLIVIGLCIGPNSNRALGQDGHEEFYKLLHTVQDILAGKNMEQSLKAIGKGAGLVYGTKQVDLRGVVTGEITTCALVDTSYHGIAIQGRTNESEDMGFFVLKTQKVDTTVVRYHSIVFLRDSTGLYRISIWHAGACE
jgi:hypothetical protein